MVTVRMVRSIEPTLINASDGSWLAIAGPGAPVRVGAFGATEDDARHQFQTALERVARALENDAPDAEATRPPKEGRC